MNPVVKSFKLLRKGEKRAFLLLLSSRVAIQILDVVGLLALGGFVSVALSRGSSSSFLSPLLPTVDLSVPVNQVILLGLITGLFFVKSALGAFLLHRTTKFLARVESASAQEVVEFLYSGDLERLKAYSRGEHVWLAGYASQIAFSTMLYSGAAIVSEGILVIMVFATFFVVDSLGASLIAIYFFSVVAVFQLSVSRRLRKVGQEVTKSAVGINDLLNNLQSAFRELSVLHRRDHFVEQYRSLRHEFAKNHATKRFIVGLPRFVIEAALMIGIAALLIWQLGTNSLTSGLSTTAIFLAGGLRMMAALLPLQNALSEIRSDGPQVRLAQEIVELSRLQRAASSNPVGRGTKNHQSALPLDELEISLRNVSFSYPGETRTVLLDISMSINPGSQVAIIGPSGAGKSTLCDIILGLLTPQVGEIKIGRQSPKELATQIPGSVAYVPQAPGLVTGSVCQNVALGLPGSKIDFGRVEQVLRQAGLWEFVDGLPEKIHSDLGKFGDNLSGGQRQRLGIARALYSDPRLLVLDEATSAMDAATEALISETIDSLKGHTTVVIIAHRLTTVERADKVYVLDNGKISASGKFSEIRKTVPMIQEFADLMRLSDD